MLESYFSGLYRRTMREAYSCAELGIREALSNGGSCLDCGASEGRWHERLKEADESAHFEYTGIEWSQACVDRAIDNGLNVIQGDLNEYLPFDSNQFDCIFALSLLEHLLMPCRFMSEAYRSLKPGGRLVLLTPNISTLFTAALIMLGKMPSSGPHPDSDSLIRSENVLEVRPDLEKLDTETSTPEHRHLVVFSFRVLRRYLNQIGFSHVEGRGFGLYPFPNFTQPVLEKIDPIHCHQMVFFARK